MILATALWGFTEATLFFIVPDVLLSMLALRSLRTALIACLAALGGALAGGLLMYQWGLHDAETALAVLDSLPAISQNMLLRVHRALASSGLAAVAFGPLSGTPYKVYAVQAGALGLSLVGFVLVSLPARLGRFLGVTLLVYFVKRLLPRGWAFKQRARFVFTGWVMFYTFYFVQMPN